MWGQGEQPPAGADVRLRRAGELPMSTSRKLRIATRLLLLSAVGALWALDLLDAERESAAYIRVVAWAARRAIHEEARRHRRGWAPR